MMSALASFFTSLYLFGAEHFAVSVSALLCVLAGAWIAHFWHKGSASVPVSPADLAQQLAQLQRDQAAIKRLLCLDELTGMPNGRYLEQIALPSALAACTASGHPLTVAFLDFDHFGAYNKRYGHAAGDQRLVEGVRAIQLRLAQGRCTDQLFRFYGAGDEFVILMPGADAARADLTLTMVRAWLHASRISVSIGAVVVPPNRSLSARAVLAQADAAMRRVKESGRGGPPAIVDAAAPAPSAVIEHTAPAASLTGARHGRRA